MQSKTVLVVLVAALTLTAGCFGGGSPAQDGESTTDPGDDGVGDGGDGDAGDGDSPDSSDGGDSGDSDGGDAPGSGDGDDGGVGDGTDGDDGGVGDGGVDELVDLRDLGNFVTTMTFSGTEGGEAFQGEFVYRVDYDDERIHMRFEGGDGPESPVGVLESFFDGNTMYTKIGDGDEAYYSVTEDQEFVDSEGVFTETLYGFGILGLSPAGTETYDGVRVTRYETTDPGFLTNLDDPTDGAGKVTDFRYVALVDDRGIGRYGFMTYTAETADGETSTLEWEFALTGVGTTTVEDPEWLDAARSSAPRLVS